MHLYFYMYMYYRGTYGKMVHQKASSSWLCVMDTLFPSSLIPYSPATYP